MVKNRALWHRSVQIPPVMWERVATEAQHNRVSIARFIRWTLAFTHEYRSEFQEYIKAHGQEII